MSRFRVTTTVVIDTGDADVWGLERFHPRDISRVVRIALLDRQVGDPLPRPQIGSVITVISDDTPGVLGEQIGTLARAERSIAQGERDRDAAAAIATELAERSQPDELDPADGYHQVGECMCGQVHTEAEVR